MEVSEEAAANLENGNTSEGGDEEPEEDRMSTGPSGQPLDAASRYEKPKKLIECHTDLQERLSPEVPQQNARVRAIAEMQKLGFTGSEVVNAATVFAKEPNQMGMFLALPEMYKREYILRMLNEDASAADLEDTGTSPVKTGVTVQDGEYPGLAAKRGLNFEEEAANGAILPYVEGQVGDPNAMILDNSPPMDPNAREGSEKDRSKRLSSTIVRGKGRNKRKWTWDEDEELVKALCEVSLDPRFRVQGGGFKNCYSQGIESLLAQRLPGRGIKVSPHVDSRLKVLKRKFYSIKDMLASPGFSWDGSRKDNPRAKGLNGIPFPHFDAFDAIYGKDRTAREGMEVSEEAAANLENGNTSEGGDEEPEEDRMSTRPSGRPLDAASRYEKPKKCKYGGKRKRIESSCPSLDMFKDVRALATIKVPVSMST
ncbi:hypothetical protein ACQ4PT_066044 [Festuca glaucescens]